MEQQYEIPRIIHFIWAGGTKLLTDKGAIRVSEWAKSNPGSQTDEKNPGFHIKLWVDSQTSGMSLDELRGHYQKIFSELGVPVLTAAELPNYQGSVTPIIIQDLDQSLREHPIKYEIEKLRPNFGASSDMLRYNILYQHGGAYFDPDVGCNLNQSLAQSKIFGLRNCHALYLDHKTQTANVSNEELSNFSLNQLGNDTFVCTKGNPLMKAIYDSTVDEYSKLSRETNLTTQHLSRAHFDIREITISTTGPQKVSQVIASCEKKPQGINLALNVNGENVLLCRVRDGGDLQNNGLELTKPLPNTRNWLQVNLRNFMGDTESAYTAALQAIEYEIDHFKIFKLDDHISHLSTLLKVPETDVAKNLTRRLLQLKLLEKPIMFTHLSFKHPSTIQLCRLITSRQPSCQNIFKLPAQFAAGILDMETSFSVLKISLADSLAYLKTNKGTLVDVYLGQAEDIVPRMADQIKKGISYVTKLLEHIDQFPIETKELFCNLLLGNEEQENPTVDNVRIHGILQLYGHFCEIFEKIPAAEMREEKGTVQELKARILTLKDQLIRERAMQQADTSQRVEVKATNTTGGANLGKK